MTTVAELGLTPTQHAELEKHPPDYVQAWLEQLDSTPDVKNRTGWFLAGIRSGRHPGQDDNQERARQAHLAETYIRNAGLYDPTPADLQDDLFGPNGRLRAWQDDQLKARMTDLYNAEQPRAQQAHRDATARAEKWKAARQHATITEGEPEPFPNADDVRDWGDR